MSESMFNNDTCPNYRLVTVIKTSAEILGKTTKAMYVFKLQNAYYE